MSTRRASSAIPVSSLKVNPLRGMDQRWRAKPSSADSIKDMTWTEQDAWKDGPGYREIVHDYTPAQVEKDLFVNAFDSEGIVTSLHWFAQHNGAVQWTIWETAAGELKYFNGSTAPADVSDLGVDRENNAYNGTDRVRTYTSTPTIGTQSYTYGGRIYLINGKDEPVVFDGRKADPAGFGSPAGQAFADILDKTDDSDPIRVDSDLIGAGEKGSTTEKHGYRYKVTFVNERGQESPASTQTDAVTYLQKTVSSSKVIAVSIPTGPANCVARRIYRTLNLYIAGDLVTGYGSDIRTSADEFYFHSEVQDNVSTVIADIIPDALLGTVLDESRLGAWPFNATIGSVFKNTVFIAGMAGNEVRFSRPLHPEVFPEDNVFQIGDASLGPVTAMYPTKNALVVFKQRGIYLIKGDPSSGFYSQTLTLDAGCAAPKTVRELPGLGLAFLSEAGGFLLEGALTNTGNPTRVVKLSSYIPYDIERLNRSALLNASAVIDRKRNEYLLTLPTMGQAEPTDMLKYHYAVGEWSTSENWPVSCMVATGDHRNYVMFGSWDTTNSPGIYVISDGWADKGGVYDVQPSYTSTHIDFGSTFSSVHPIRFLVYAVGYGDNDIRCNFLINRELDQVYTTDRSHDQRYPLDKLPVYGTVKFGEADARFSEHRPVVVRFDVSASHKGQVHELQASFSAEKRRIQIVGYDIEVKTGSQKRPKPLTLSYGGGASR